MARSSIQIGKVSEQTGLSVDSIRFYEKQRLLERPPRSEGGFRFFNTQDIKRIQCIQCAQQLGFSLPEIRELVLLQRGDGAACSHVRDLLKTKIVHNKIAELAVLERQLTNRLRNCECSLRAVADVHKGYCPDEIAHQHSDEH